MGMGILHYWLCNVLFFILRWEDYRHRSKYLTIVPEPNLHIIVRKIIHIIIIFANSNSHLNRCNKSDQRKLTGSFHIDLGTIGKYWLCFWILKFTKTLSIINLREHPTTDEDRLSLLLQSKMSLLAPSANQIQKHDVDESNFLQKLQIGGPIAQT